MSSPFTPPEVDQEIAPPSALELLWVNHRGSVIGVIAGMGILGLVILGVIASNRATVLASESLLAAATNDAGWNEVISRYPKTPAAADAMLLLAASLRDAGKLEESNNLYSRFAETFPQSPLAVSGQLGRASNARLAGNLDQALAAYQQASAAYPQSYGAPFALFSSIRLLAQQGKMDDAKRLLQSLGSQYAASVSAQAAGTAPRQPQSQN